MTFAHIIYTQDKPGHVNYLTRQCFRYTTFKLSLFKSYLLPKER